MRADTPVRSLADDLRARSPEQLGELLNERPDLLFRTPRDISELAARASTPHSVGRALAKCDQFELLVALGAAIGPGPLDARRISRQLGRPAGGAVERLTRLGLVWGAPNARHVVGAVRDVLVPRATGPRVAALDAAVRHFAENPADLVAEVMQAPAQAREALYMLLGGSVVAELAEARRAVTSTMVHTPVEWLLARHLLIPVADDQVAVPAEVAAVLRADDPAQAHQEVASVAPPPVSGTPVPPEQVDAAGLTAAWQFLRDVEELCWLWERQPPPVLRTGALGSRARTAAARAMSLSAERVGLLAVVAAEAGLVNHTSDREAVWLPSKSFDRWRSAPHWQRWLDLASAWLTSRRGGAEDIGSAWQVHGLASLRRLVLQVVSECPAPPSETELLARIQWAAPLRWNPETATIAQAVLAEASSLGVVGRGALTAAGAALLAARSPAAADPQVREIAQGWFPPPVTEIILQADLTAVVPGPPTAELARFLRRCAHPESLDVAAVHRFTRESLANGLASGLAAADILADLQRYSKTGIPQALEVLLADAARSYGSLRAGAAGSYLRSDDPTQLAGLLNHPKLASLGLTQIAPTVLVSAADRGELVGLLERAGVTVAAEGKAGQLLKTSLRRAAAPRPFTGYDFDFADPRIVAQAVAELTRPASAGSLGTAAPPSQIPQMNAAEVRSALAAATSGRVWIAYDPGLGAPRTVLAEDVHVLGDLLMARHPSGFGRATYPLARIMGVVSADPAPADPGD